MFVTRVIPLRHPSQFNFDFYLLLCQKCNTVKDIIPTLLQITMSLSGHKLQPAGM